jgi:hypothetical protein
MKCGIGVWVYLVLYVVVKGMVVKKMGSVDGSGRKVIKFASDKMDAPDGVTFKKAEIIEKNMNSSNNDGKGGYSFKEKDKYNWVKGGRMFWVDNENDGCVLDVLKRNISNTIVDLISDIINITNTNYNTYNNNYTTLTTINNIFNEYKSKLSSTINELIQTNNNSISSPTANITSSQQLEELNTTTLSNQTNNISSFTTTTNSASQPQLYSLDDTDESSIISEILTTLNT